METGRLVDVQTGGRNPESSQGPAVNSVAPRRWLLSFGIAVTWVIVALLVWFAFRQTPFHEILSVLYRLRPGSILVLVLVNLGFLVLANLRWWVLLRSFDYKISLVSLMAYRLAGYGLSYITPGPQFGGEPLQVYLLHRREGVQLESAISSVFLDRLIDLLANFTFLLVGSIVVVSSGLLDSSISDYLWVLALFLITLPAGHILLLFFGKRPASWLLSRLSWDWLRKFLQMGIRSEEQIAVLIQTKTAVLISLLGFSALIWGGAILEFWLCLRFLGVNAGVQETISALTAARLAFLFPVPGGLGVLETSQFLAASMLGWGAAAGIAVSLVIRARDVLLAVFGLLLGFGFNHSLILKQKSNEKE